MKLTRLRATYKFQIRYALRKIGRNVLRANFYLLYIREGLYWFRAELAKGNVLEAHRVGATVQILHFMFQGMSKHTEFESNIPVSAPDLNAMDAT